MTWVVMKYLPVSIFSLRPAQVTASGGKSLLTPTAFALKMALLNASIQTAGLEEGKRRFPTIRDLRIALRLPDHITSIKSFAKVRRLYQDKMGQDKGGGETLEDFRQRQQDKITDLTEKGQYPFQPTIAYREFVQFGDPLLATSEPGANLVRVACAAPQGEAPTWASAAASCNRWGLRRRSRRLTTPSPRSRATAKIFRSMGRFRCWTIVARG